MTMIPTDVLTAVCQRFRLEIGQGPSASISNHDLLAMRAALSAAKDLGWVMRRESDFSSGQSWQPIETAPKDAPFMGWERRYHTPQVCFFDGRSFINVTAASHLRKYGTCEHIPPTHWMKLPPPPVTPEKEKAISLNPHSKQD